MSLQSIYELRPQPVLLGATTGACMVAAEDIINEAANTPNHVNRLVWANSNPDNNAREMMPAIAMNPTVQTKWAERTLTNEPEWERFDDVDIQFVVDSNINRFATSDPELAVVDLTAQGAAILATTIFTPTVSRLFRLSAYLQLTRAATTSSTLGGATGLVVTYTEPDGSIAQSNVMAMQTPAGAVAINSTGNTTITKLNGSMVINAKAGVPIQFAVGYTSSGATSMQYALHLKLEAV